MIHNQHKSSPSVVERISAIIAYIFPLFGFLFIILAFLMKKDMKPFLKFHIFQAIFIAFGLWIIITGLTYLMNMLSIIPIIKNIVGMITFFLNTPLILGFSVVTTAYSLFVMYLIFGALMGKYSYVPYISDIIKTNLRGQL